MIQDTAGNLQNIPHSDFVDGMQNGTIECWLGEPYELPGSRKALFNLLFLLYTVGPIILIPLWAYHVRNWFLLIGVAISYLATVSAGQYSRIVFLFGCYWIGFLIHSGFSVRHYTTFYFFCALG